MVERDDRSPVATFFTTAPLAQAAGTLVALSEAAGHHARVRRIAAGDVVRLTDGAGRLALGRIASLAHAAGDVAIETVATIAPPPAIHLRAAIGDRDRMLLLAEKATELGVASWQGVQFRRSMSVSPRGEGLSFVSKVRARMVSALEQSGGAWLPQLLPDTTPDAIAADRAATRILLDAAGEPLLQLAGDASTVILLGPEGGLEPNERAALASAGWRSARLAATTLRFETAGIAALAVLRAAQMLRET